MPSVNNLLITNLAFILLGILVGMIFLADAWSTPRESSDGVTVPLRSSPKMRGLVYVISGGIIPSAKDILTSLVKQDKTVVPAAALVIYTLSFSLTVLIGLLILSLYAFIVAYTYLGEAKPNATRTRLFALALPYVITALRRGDFAFKQQLQEISLLSQELIRQRDNSVEFLTGAFTALVRGNINNVSGIDEFIQFSEKYLQVFIQQFLEQKGELENYRACIYFRDTERLVFLAGVSPFEARHSREPLSLNLSLAGWALQRPDEAHIHIRGRNQARNGQIVPFEGAERTSYFFKSVISCAIKPLNNSSSQSSMVLCIDCSRGSDNAFTKNDEYDFIKKLVLFLAVIIATAKASMSVSDSAIKEWIDRQN
jgi:hypothetical protein